MGSNMVRFAVVTVVALFGVACAAEPEGDEAVSEQSDELISLDKHLNDTTASCAQTICGDVNRDGQVTVTDAVIVQKIAAGLIRATPGACGFRAADVDGNGVISVTDGVNIQRRAAGLSASFKCKGVSPFGPVTRLPNF